MLSAQTPDVGRRHLMLHGEECLSIRTQDFSILKIVELMIERPPSRKVTGIAGIAHGYAIHTALVRRPSAHRGSGSIYTLAIYARALHGLYGRTW